MVYISEKAGTLDSFSPALAVTFSLVSLVPSGAVITSSYTLANRARDMSKLT